MVGALGLCRQYPAEKLLLLGGLEAQHWPEVIGGGGFGIALQSGADHPEKLSAHLRELAKFPRLPSL